MATFRDFEELEIWQEAKRLYRQIQVLTDRDGVRTDYRFRSNLREAAGSIMDNIAEGFERDSQFEFVNHLSYSKGSTGEGRSELYRGADCSYWTEAEAKSLGLEYKELSSHIANFIKYLNGSDFRGQKFKNR